MQIDLLDRWRGQELLQNGRLIYRAGGLVEFPVQLLRLWCNLDLDLISL